jgi:beta-glucanase (GH16 family)
MTMLLVLLACAPDARVPTPAEWREVWADRFEGAAGDPPAAHWVPDLGAGGWGNQELQSYTAENAALDGDGHLVITAREESRDGARYTSARLTTRGTFAAMHGRFEARIKVPEGQGLWPAFWMLGDDFGDVGWPGCGEIDVMEHRGGDPAAVEGAVHGPGYSGGSPISGGRRLTEGSLADDFHVYAVQRDEGRITWWLDDVRYHEVTRADLPAGAPWPFEKDFFLLLNLAVGGVFGGDPDATTPFPAELVVDEVRVLERAE